ncbi:MAG: amidase [Firmicutes bacterium]|nr:amidase [Bacillota bacterium]
MTDVTELTVSRLSEMLATGETTSVELVKTYMDRIAKIDKSGPCLNSVLELNPDALFIAAAMDRERAKGKLRSPLHGVPVLLKDNINTADKLRTTGGSLALADNFAPYDASVVSRLRKAGLIILGKTNMTEFANFMAYHMKNGYSSRGGQVISAYNPIGDVSGSSSGSAVALSANLCALAVGTETDGSILSPAFNNSVVGIKPTMGLVSRWGILPICSAQDTAGPMGRTVADCAALLNIMVGEDENDPATWCLEDRIPEDYTAFLKKDGLRGLRVGINRGYMENISDDRKALAEEAFKTIEGCGAEIVNGVDFPRLRIDEPIMRYEFQKCLNAYLSTVNTRCRSMKDIIDFFGDHKNEALKYGMEHFIDAQFGASGNCTDPEYIQTRLDALRLSQKEGLDRILDENRLDVLVCPGSFDYAPVSGYPGIGVPAGYDSQGLPYGICFIGRAFSEPLLISAAYSYEQASLKRKAPSWGDLR